jgi:hypothetical protein
VTNDDGATMGDTWSIEPAAVTISTLTINGKQVTLDVFRQLKEAALINYDGSFAGSPWGLVNYHQKKCDKLGKHAHVVWQLDDQLRQDTIQPPRWEPYRSDTCDALVFAAGTVEPAPDVTWPTEQPSPEKPVRTGRSRASWPRLAARAILMLALKDVHLALQAAGDDRFAALACLADEWQRVVDHGLGDRDLTVVTLALQRQGGSP